MKFGTSTKGLVKALKRVARDFDDCAKRSPDGKVYIPANLDRQQLQQLVEHPEDIRSQGNEGTEPCYPSLKEGSSGRNDDGSLHVGFIVVDTSTGEVVDLVSRNGTSLLMPESETATESKTITVAPIVAALVKAEEILGTKRTWQATNDEQRRFLTEVFESLRNDVGSIPEIESIVSYDVEEINRFLAKRGFSIRLQPFTGDGEFGTASVLDMLVEWLKLGNVTEVETPDHRKFPAVKLEAGVRFIGHVPSPNPVVEIETKSGDMVYMTMYENAPDDFDLLQLVNDLLDTSKEDRTFDYKGVVFPMVNLNQEVNISWLLGMHCQGVDDKPGIVSQAVQQTKFRMNEKGARVQSAVAMAVTRGIDMRQPHVINRPFLLWIMRPGIDVPIFASWITPEDWKNPDSLE